MSGDPLQAVAASCGGTLSSIKKATILTVEPGKVEAACKGVSSIPGLYHLSTITGVDLGEKIALFYHFWQGKAFVAVKTLVPKSDLRVPSISAALPSAVLYEAEVKDLLGVVFEGNPFMKARLLLPDEYPKDAPPPLRKEADPAKIRRMMGLE